MLDEYKALKRQGTQSLVPLPPDKQTIACKWVFRLKKNSDGFISRHKSRLVAKGFLQIEGVDYHETFSPVAKQPTIRVLLCLALHFHCPIKQLDISNAVLHGILEEEVYMHQPQGFIDANHPSLVCKLHKALYGLKQAPRAWFSTFSSFLLSHDFVPSHCDSSLFIKHTSTSITILLVYVDDILLTGSDPLYISTFVQHMHSAFSMKELGLLNYFLGISVASSPSGYILSQQKYASEILAKAGMSDCKPYSSPMATKNALPEMDSPLSEPSLYRSLVGALQYLTLTRPDLSFTVNYLCQFLQTPLNSHFAAVKRLLRYLKGTLSHGLHFSFGPLVLNAFLDSDWASSALDRRSTTGYCVFLGPNLISWCTKKQPIVSRSSSGVEYRALAQVSTELSQIGMLLIELHVSVDISTLWYDNLSAIALAHNPVFHARTKHIEVDYHFVRERVAAKKLAIFHIASTDQIADVLTKPLSVSRFQYLQGKLQVFSIALSLRGTEKHKPQADHSSPQLQQYPSKADSSSHQLQQLTPDTGQQSYELQLS